MMNKLSIEQAGMVYMLKCLLVHADMHKYQRTVGKTTNWEKFKYGPFEDSLIEELFVKGTKASHDTNNDCYR